MWRHYLQGAPFVIKTDHFSLKYLLEQRLTHPIQHKGLCKLLDLDYTIQYKKGIKNVVADALSRKMNVAVGKEESMAVTELIPVWMEELKESYEEDEWVQAALRGQLSSREKENITVHQGIIRVKGRLYVGSAKGWRCKVMMWMHNSSIGGHSGILGTYQRTKKMFYWPKMKAEIIAHIKSCDICQLNKHELNPPAGLLDPIPIPEGAWQTITMDFITGLPKSEGKEVIMVIVDKFTKYGHFIPLAHPFSAIDIAKVFMETVYKLHGLPTKLITDRDPIFTSVFWRELMKKLEIKVNLSTSYHPQTDGQSERLNQCLEQYLRCMVGHNPKQWTQWIYLAEWWYNSTFHTAIQMTPFKALYGYDPPHIALGSVPVSRVEAVDEVLRERHSTMQQLKEQLKKAQEKMKLFADRKRVERHFSVGAWVYLKLQPYRQTTVHKRGNCKLSSKYYGPFEVIEKIGKMAYKLNLPAGSQVHPVFHVSQLKERVGTGTIVNAQLPIVGSQGKLKVEPVAVLDRRIIKKRESTSSTNIGKVV
jgi:Integrase zinc binding domain